MFTWLNKQGVQSDEGFALQFVERFSAEYREGSKVMEVEIEDGFLNGKPAVNVSREAFKAWQGDSSTLPEDVQKRIADNFRRACEFQGLSVVFD
ncbi:hypothetical protein BOSP111201_13140 [Bordetella sputigena]|uniref:hypothetical protein n=1 Tax=Bordetella sputigena TaxID=1416810 RepID=UPI0039F10081